MLLCCLKKQDILNIASPFMKKRTVIESFAYYAVGVD